MHLLGIALLLGNLVLVELRLFGYVAAAELGTDWVNVDYLLRVVSPCTFTLPAPQAEDMYGPELRGAGRAGGGGDGGRREAVEAQSVDLVH